MISVLNTLNQGKIKVLIQYLTIEDCGQMMYVVQPCSYSYDSADVKDYVLGQSTFFFFKI